MLKNSERLCACGCLQIVHLETDNYTIVKNAKRNRYYYGNHYKYHLVDRLNKSKTAKEHKVTYDINSAAVDEYIADLIKYKYIEVRVQEQ